MYVSSLTSLWSPVLVFFLQHEESNFVQCMTAIISGLYITHWFDAVMRKDSAISHIFPSDTMTALQIHFSFSGDILLCCSVVLICL